LVNIISSNQYSHEIRVEAQQQMRLNITTNK